MRIIKCKYCGGSVTLTGTGHGYCDYCGQELTLPVRQEERTLAMYERASYFRGQGEFDRAYSAYRHLAEENPEDPEFYWCMTLCRYGVEYVEDKRLSDEEAGIREYKPTMSRMNLEPVLEDPDYQAALACADEAGRRLYRQEAGKLARIQSRYLEIIRNEAPYDVFISFQSEEEDGSRTEASVLGQEIYERLTGKGLKVFFSRITLEGMQGQEYEPYIFSALQTSKVMLLVADNGKQLKGRWVMNEWSRFLSMKDKGKTIIPVYNSKGKAHMSPYDFPDAISAMQAQDMANVGAMQDLVRGVCKLAGHEEAARTVILEGGVSLEALLRRAEDALKTRSFSEAKQLIDEVLDVDAKNPQAYLCQLLLVNRAATLQELAKIRPDWSDDRNYQRAKRYAGERQKTELARFEEDCRREGILRQAGKEADEGRYAQALTLLSRICGYPGAEELTERCRREKEKEDLLAQYRQEIGDPGDYLLRRFQKDYPSEAKQWETLRDDAEEANDIHGRITAFVVAVLAMLFAFMGVASYVAGSMDSVNIYFIAAFWALICGFAVYKHCEYYSIKERMLLPAAIFFAVAAVPQIICDLVKFYETIFSVLIMAAVSIGLVCVCRKDAALELFRKRYTRKRDLFYEDVVEPAERELRKKVDEEWTAKVGKDKVQELEGIW